MQRICEVIAPIFTPLGFGEWGVVSALVSGIVAKEIIVGTIATINGVGGMDIASSIMDTTSLVHFDTSSALSFMAFALLYRPCLSSISVMIKQLGKKSTCKALCIQFCTAYIVSLLIYWSYRLLDWRIIFIVILFAIICGLILLGHNKSKKCSHCCSHCESCYLKK